MSESIWICERCHMQFKWVPQYLVKDFFVGPHSGEAKAMSGKENTRPERCPRCGSRDIDQSEG